MKKTKNGMVNDKQVLDELFDEEDVEDVMEKANVSREEAIGRLNKAVEMNTTKMEIQAERSFGESIGKKINKLQKSKDYTTESGLAKGIGKLVKKEAKKIDRNPKNVLIESPDDDRNPSNSWHVVWEEGPFEWALNATSKTHFDNFILEPYWRFSIMVNEL